VTSDRWTLGLVVAAAICCAAPLLIGAGMAGAAWAALRDHWGWAALVLGGVAGVAVLAMRRRARPEREP
jgi:multisubunit Na+/H+ antiporter MnhE subunit